MREAADKIYKAEEFFVCEGSGGAAGALVRAMADGQGYTQKYLAKITGYSPVMISKTLVRYSASFSIAGKHRAKSGHLVDVWVYDAERGE